MRHALRLAILAWACLPGLALAAKMELQPCATESGMPPGARCGTYEVWENRAAKSGRKIPLRVVVLPARSADPLPDPFIYFAGGPGDSSVAGAPWMAQDLGDLLKRRDILLVDFRGTGGSGGLTCPEMLGSSGLQGFLDEYLPADRVKVCGERLKGMVDLSQYTSDNVVDDIDEVRAALGYDRLNILGVSGGSRLAQVYTRRHPDRVRTMILWGVVPTDELGPFSMAKSVQRALDGLIAECEGDPACRRAFPDFRGEVAAVFQRVEKEPVAVSLVDGETGKPFEIRMTRNGLATTVRYMLYGPGTAALLPLNVHEAARGNWRPMAETARLFASNLSSINDGFYLALTCAEDLPFIREEEIPAAVQGTFLGDFRIRKQQAACAAWPGTPVSRAFLEPVATDVPALLISGERDPVTPPSHADRVAPRLKNHLNVVVPDGGHSFDGIEGAECVNGLIVQLVESGSVKGLDASSCLKRTRRPRFALETVPEVKLTADQLARLAGSYREAATGLTARIEVIGDRLRAVLGEQPPVVLAPVSPTRFRVEGLPPGYFMDFQVTDGGATATMLQPGAPSHTLTREGGI